MHAVLTPERVPGAPTVPAWARPSPKTRRALWVALALSLAVHLAFSFWPATVPEEAEDIPLTATLTELPPPPAPTPPAEPAKPKAARKAAARPAPASPESAVMAEHLAPVSPAPPAAAAAPAAAAPASPEPLVEPADVAAALPPSARTLPPRVDLAYKLYLGTSGFLIGDATYRFEHSGNRYRIRTVGRAKGLAALLIRGEGRLESDGLITAEGLQPSAFAFERSDTGKREEARFDWEAGIVTLSDDKTAPIDTPMLDALSLMWQYYFTPPDAHAVAFSIATTRRVVRYTVTLEGTETLPWGNRTIEAERWHRVSDDGKSDSYAWLAPSLRYLPVKMRLSNARGTVEIVLDGIHVDPSQNGGSSDWAPNVQGAAVSLEPATPGGDPKRTPAPQEFAPGAVFPTNTGG